jgi:uncharacterized protein (TIRG00374 family)
MTETPSATPSSPLTTWLAAAVRVGLSLAVSLILLVLIFRLVTAGGEQVDPQDLLQAVQKAAWPFVLLYVVLQIGQTLFRAERYRLLIGAGGQAEVPGRFHTFLVTAVRNMCVDMFPARAGELTYVAMMNRGYRVSVNVCLSSLGVSLLFDFIALFFVLAGALVLPLMASEMRGAMLTGLVAVALISLVAALLLFVGLRLGLAVLAWFLGLAPEAVRDHGLTKRLMAFFTSIADAVDTTRQAGVFLRTLVLSMGVRICKYAGLYFVFLAITLPTFETLAGAPFWNVLTALLAAEGAASLPLPSFMSFGTYEAGGLLALKMLGFSASASAITMLAMHLISQAVDYTIGGLAFAVFTLAGPGAERTAVGQGVRRMVIILGTLVGCALVVAGGLHLLERRRARKMGSATPPPGGQAVDLSRAQKRAQRDALQDLDGFIVWSSNRHGQHDILLRELPGLKTRRLTDHPHVDTFPRVSPDGSRVVFARSREPWVSQRQDRPWDVYLVDVDSGEERLVAEWGNVPTWSADGTHVFFQRDSGRVVEHNLETGLERVVFAAGSNGVPSRVHLQTPSVDAGTGRMAVTLRGGKRYTGVFDASGAGRKIAGGCQLTWSHDASGLYYVDKGGRGGNTVYWVDPSSRKREPWLDLPDPYSHEYFPKDANDGSVLVLGASAQGHEHDMADYEIFLWKIGTPEGEAVRITHHTGNDCWPDVWVAH